MPVNWNEFDPSREMERIDARAKERFFAEISSLTRMTEADFEEMCPTKEDREALSAMVKGVKTATSAHEKQQIIINNVEKFATSIVSIIEKFI